MKRVFILIVLPIFSFISCMNRGEILTAEPIDVDNTSSEISLWINSYVDKTENQVRLITQEGATINPENWNTKITTISGFEFVPGYIYHVKVLRTEINSEIEIRLIEMLSNERDPAYFRLHDIWVLTHLNGEVLEISETRPNSEINLTEMRVSGKANCNNYSGEIKRYTGNEIEFGTLAGTRMMCPQMEAESDFYKALESVRFHELKGLTLLLFNAEKSEVLRYQKVD